MGNLFPCCCQKYRHAEALDLYELRTGDIVLFREPQCAHLGAWCAQNLLCWEANHVGLVLHPSDFGADSRVRRRHELQDGRPYVFHALLSGVKVWDLEAYGRRITREGGCFQSHCWARQLLTEGPPGTAACPGDALRALIAHKADEFFEEIREASYQLDPAILLSAYFDTCEMCCCANDEYASSSSSIFCSELVAETLQRAGIISNDIASNEFVPMDFLLSNGLNIERSKFVGVRLGPPRKVQLDDSESSCSS